MIHRKKGQGLSLTTIIVAAIGLVVLVVLIAIFTGRIGGFSKGIDDVSQNTCEQRGGNCKPSCEDNEVRVFGINNCEGDTPLCCAPSG